VGSGKLLVLLLLLCSTLVVQSSFHTPRVDSWDEEGSHAADVADRADTGDKKTEEIQYRADFEDDEDSDAELLVQQAARGALEPAQVDRYLVKSVLAQLDDTSSHGSSGKYRNVERRTDTKSIRSNGQTSECEEWGDDDKIGGAAKCSAGSGLCVTIKFPNGVMASKCDADGMCDGTLYSAGDQKRSYTGIRGRAPGKTSYYYQPLTSGMCGTYPSTRNQLYCTTKTPPYGRIPKGIQCPPIQLAASSRMASLGWTTIVAMLAMVGYMA